MSFSFLVSVRRFVAALIVVAVAVPVSASVRDPRLSTTAAERAAARLERVSFTPSSRLPGMVIRLHFDRRVDSFELRRRDHEGRLEVQMNVASARRGLTCDRAPAPVESCSIAVTGSTTSVSIETAGRIMTADLYRDGSQRTDLLLYLHAASEERAVAEARTTPADDIPVVNTGLNETRTGRSISTPVAFRQEGAAPAPIETIPSSQPTGAGRIADLPATGSATGETGVTDDAPGETIAAEAARLRIDTIVLDAGHGGKDPGTIGHNRIREKDVVLDVALRVGAYLRDAGLNVVYTRDDDTFIDLKERGKMALDAGGKLFVSIHANSARDTRARGTETFYLGANKTTAARDVIERENQVIDLEDDRAHYDQFDGAQLARLRLTQSANLRQSLDLASRMQEQYRDRVGRHDRKVKEGNLYVLWSAGMPAILTEIGFISNPEEARYLTSEEGKDHIASAIFRAIRDYIQAYEASLDLAARG